MSIKAGALAIFIASSSATMEQHKTDQPWQVQGDDNVVVVRAYHKDSKTHLMLGCSLGSPVSLIAHRADGEEGWFVNLKVDDGESVQYGGSVEGMPGIVFDQINTDQESWKHQIKEMLNGKVLKVLTNFSNGDTLSRIPLKGFTDHYKDWLGKCEKREWMF